MGSGGVKVCPSPLTLIDTLRTREKVVTYCSCNECRTLSLHRHSAPCNPLVARYIPPVFDLGQLSRDLA